MGRRLDLPRTLRADAAGCRRRADADRCLRAGDTVGGLDDSREAYHQLVDAVAKPAEFPAAGPKNFAESVMVEFPAAGPKNFAESVMVDFLHALGGESDGGMSRMARMQRAHAARVRAAWAELRAKAVKKLRD